MHSSDFWFWGFILYFVTLLESGKLFDFTIIVVSGKLVSVVNITAVFWSFYFYSTLLVRVLLWLLIVYPSFGLQGVFKIYTFQFFNRKDLG